MALNLPNINHSICAECGGLCCRNSGCALIPTDISTPFRYNKLIKKLKTGKYSLKIAVHYNSFLRCYEYQLRICVRNKDKDIIDLFSTPSPCSIWSPETGCPFSDEERPYQGLHLIPVPYGYGCGVDYDNYFMFEKWQPVQEDLERVFKEYSNKPVLDVLSEQYKKSVKDFKALIGNTIEEYFGYGFLMSIECILRQHGLL